MTKVALLQRACACLIVSAIGGCAIDSVDSRGSAPDLTYGDAGYVTPPPTYAPPSVRYVPSQQQYVQPRTSDRIDGRAVSDAAAQLKGSMVNMFNVVNQFGPDNYQRLRADMRNMDATIDAMQFAIGQREDYGQVNGRFGAVQNAAGIVDEKLRTMQAHQVVRDAWTQVLGSMQNMSETLR